MSKARQIKHEHTADKELPNISLQAHLLWILLWSFSDDEGIFENDIDLIRSQVFPRRKDVSNENIKQWLTQLQDVKFILPFEHNGVNYYINRTFKKHQNIGTPEPSKIPQSKIKDVIEFANMSVKERADRFALSLREYHESGKYSYETVNNFYKKWKQLTPDKKRMLFEVEEGFNIEDYLLSYYKTFVLKNKNAPDGFVLDFEKEIDRVRNDTNWKDSFCSSQNIIYSEFEILLNEFITKLKLKSDFKDSHEIKKHFTSVYFLNIKNGKANITNSPTLSGFIPKPKESKCEALSRW